MRIDIADELAGRLTFAAVAGTGITVRRDDPDLWKDIEALSRELRERFADLKPSRVEDLRPARDLYKAAGVDPTRRRPASEALFRRVVRGRDLYRINNAVDACNFCSLRFFLPIGLYDLEAVRGETVTLRKGREGEGYKGLGKDSVTLDGHICVADAEGPFGHPSGDSFRTRITESTREILWLIFAPADYDPARLDDHAAFSAETIRRACGGSTGRL